MKGKWIALAGALVLALSLGGCGLTVPTDPEGTLENIEGGTLHAGVSLDPGVVKWVDEEAVGPLADLVEGFASDHHAQVDWQFGSEETLVGDLEDGKIDIAVGAITSETPWASRAGVSRSFAGLTIDGDEELVFLVPMGENRLLTELEKFADEWSGQ